MQSVSMGSHSRPVQHARLKTGISQRLSAPAAPRLAFGSSETATKENGQGAQPKRSRLGVFNFAMKRYFTKGGFLGDIGLSVLIGGVIALGTPVFVVTFPATLAVLTGLSMVRAALFAKNNDPNGELVNKMYATWAEVDRAGGIFRWMKLNAEAQRKIFEQRLSQMQAE